MTVSLSRLASDSSRFRRSLQPFPNGRSAFSVILQRLFSERPRHVLLPAYIGWSAREGSGVFDPVKALAPRVDFYRLDRTLSVHLDDLERQLARARGAVLLLIHYFGRVDPSYDAIRDLAARYDVAIVEDEAHAMLTDLVGGRCGRAGGSAFVSFHKLLPMAGGALISNGCPPSGSASGVPELQTYDLHGIARARIANFTRMLELMRPLGDLVDPIWPTLDEGDVPQTFPVLLRGGTAGREYRDAAYTKLGERGFGAVSLYHTMIPEISPTAFPDSHAVSRAILNLPVHQDLAPEGLTEGVAVFRQVLEALR